MIPIYLYQPDKIPAFYDRVYKIVAQIPAGTVATYGQIAAMAGNPFAARAVGTAMRKVPAYLNLPCHRVINKSGKLAPSYAFGGAGKQKELLEKEGIVFGEKDTVDLRQYQWRIHHT